MYLIRLVKNVIRSVKNVNLFGVLALAVFLSVVCYLLMAMPVAYAGHDPQYALEFDGVDDYVAIGVTNLGYNYITVEVWISPESWSNTDRNQILCGEQLKGGGTASWGWI